MPINKNDFDKGRIGDTIIGRIQTFLGSNKDAYTEGEILTSLYPDHHAWPGDHNGFNNAMHILAYAGKVETRYVTTDAGVQTYYRGA
jgi:hypothetical protein